MQYHLLTFGCQMNNYDSQKIEIILNAGGHSRAESEEEADVILLNTCSIRDKAEAKVFSKLGRIAEMKTKGKNRIVALGGCMATLRKEEIFRRAPVVDMVFGPDNVESLPRLIENFVSTGERQLEANFADKTVWDGWDLGRSPVSSPVGIAKGCDNHCSYCIVPSTRGPEISRPHESILAEIGSLVEKGCKETMLIGQNVNSYGKGTPVDFPTLLRLVENIDGIERVRFMTSHPKDLNDDLIETMARSKKICRVIHLPVQSGSTKVLAAMNRGYTAKEYLEKISRLKKAVPDVAVSTDVMVGFPGETEDDFVQTLDVMEQVAFDSLFLFNYSPRPGTSSNELEGALTREISQSRFDRALALHRSIMGKKLSGFVGTDQEILCEGLQTGGGQKMVGRTTGNHLVFFDGGESLTGRILQITITGVLGYNLAGKMSAK